MSAALAEKCAQAKALMEEARRLLVEVLQDPEYSEDRLPRAVSPSGALDYLPDAIAMLPPRLIPQPWDDDYIERSRMN